MHRVKYIVNNISRFKSSIENRWLKNVNLDHIKELYDQVKLNIDHLCKLQHKKNNFNKNSHNFANLSIAEMDTISIQSKEIESKIKIYKEQNESLLKVINQQIDLVPNILANDVPIGKSENDNSTLRIVGNIKKNDFNIKSHDDICLALNLIDFEQTNKISGARFVSMYGDLSMLERALINFMLDNAKSHSYIETSPVIMVKRSAMYNAGQLPKFADEAFHIEKQDMFPIPTSEVPLVNLFANKIIDAKDLPIRIAACTPCFRSEAGSSGRDTKGILRMHQFYKVELVSIALPSQSSAELGIILETAESILRKLLIPYRVVELCSGDIGFTSSRTFDIEAWMPYQNKYREISSCSNCANFQSLRMNTKVKFDDKSKDFAHTLNGSALAVGRLIVAIVENYQNSDGTISVPDILIPYMGGLKFIRKNNKIF